MANEHTREGKFKRENGGHAIGGITVAYFAAPFLAKCDPAYLLWGGFFLGVAILTGYERVVLNEKTARNKVWLIASLVLGLSCLFGTALSTASRLQRLDSQCAKLQVEMLNGRAPGTPAPPAGRSDPADAFQALGCRAS
jgi:hypothetical protein